MAMKILVGMKDSGEIRTGTFEMDETYDGGKPRKSGKKTMTIFRPIPEVAELRRHLLLLGFTWRRY